MPLFSWIVRIRMKYKLHPVQVNLMSPNLGTNYFANFRMPPFLEQLLNYKCHLELE